MTDTQHTPGPWMCTTGEDGAVIYNESTIAAVPIDLIQWHANARLIAAAPDLLSALQDVADELADFCQQYHERPGEKKLEAAYAAIAKAQGESS